MQYSFYGLNLILFDLMPTLGVKKSQFIVLSLICLSLT